MTVKRILILGVLGIVFSSALLSANVLVAADQTVMDSEYAAETAEEAKLHETLEGEIETQLQVNESTAGTDLPLDRSVDELLADAITSEYIQAQIEANMDRFYAYLHGNTAELTLTVDTEPVIENVVAELETDLQELQPSDFDDTLSDLGPEEMQTAPGTATEEMAESEDQFLSHRQAFEERVKEQIQEETPYPMTDEQLDRAYEDRRDEIRADLIDAQDEQLTAAIENGAIPASFEEPVRTIMVARIDALTSKIGYETYAQRVDTGMDELRAAVLAEAEATIRADAPESVNLTDEFSAQERSSMETAQTATSAASTLAIVLPLVALGAAALVAWVYPASVAARTIGTGAALVGLGSLVGAQVASGAVGTAIESADGPEAAIRFVQLLLDGLFGLLAWQSGGLLVVGIGLIAVSVAIRRELILPDYE